MTKNLQMRGTEKAANEPYPNAGSLALTSAFFSLRSKSDEKAIKCLFITVSEPQRLRNEAVETF